MAGLLDFLFQGQGGQGGGLFGGMYGQQGGQQMGSDGMPMQISPGPQQQGLNVPNLPPQGMQQPQMGGMAGSLDPSFFANQVRQNQQQPGLLFDANSGLLGGMRGALNQISDPMGQRQQNAIQNYLAVKAAEEKPQYMKVQDPNTGIERLVQIQPFGRGAGYVNPSEPGGSGGAAPGRDPSIPVGADVKTVREARAKATVANEEESVKAAKAAADLAPHLDQAVAAYQAAIDAKAIGPIAASGVARANEKYNPFIGLMGGSAGEKARQNYDRAIASLQARITSGQNSGQGAVSDYERKMYAAQFPDLQALDPAQQLDYLKQLQAQTQQTIAAGKIPAIGQAPQVGAVLNRPSIPGGLPQPGAPPAQGAPAAPAGPQIAPPGAPVKVTTQAQYNLLPSGSPYIAPDGSPRTKR